MITGPVLQSRDSGCRSCGSAREDDAQLDCAICRAILATTGPGALTLCPACMLLPIRFRAHPCVRCLLRDADAQTPLAQERDALAVWLAEAEQVLEAMDHRADPRFAAGFAVWQRRLARYELLARLTPLHWTAP